MEKGVFVKDIVPNAEAAGIFAVADAALAQSRNGPYWRLVLADASGSVEAKIWSPLSGDFSEIAPGTLAWVEGRASLFRSALQLAVEKFRPLDAAEAASLDQTAFLPSSPYPIDGMDEELRELCLREFTHKPWRRLVFAVLDDEELGPRFRIAPAAKNVHHAYAGGLLEHTLGVFRLCRRMAAQYAELDRQTLLAGALFHDFGKIREFSGGLNNDYTGEGRLLGHLLLGVEMLGPFLVRSRLESGLQEHLKHLILSHHGELEFGAVRQPHTPEALALHCADNLDAKLAQCRGLFTGLEGDGPAWTPWQPTLGRPMYRQPRTQGGREGAPQERKTAKWEVCLSLLKA